MPSVYSLYFFFTLFCIAEISPKLVLVGRVHLFRLLLHMLLYDCTIVYRFNKTVKDEKTGEW